MPPLSRRPQRTPSRGRAGHVSWGLATTLLSSCLLLSVTREVLAKRPRVAVTTDINLNPGSDPDDRQSLATLFWYADVLDLKLIVPENSWPGKNGPDAYRDTLSYYHKDYYNVKGTRFQELGFPAPSFFETIMKDRYQGISHLKSRDSCLYSDANVGGDYNVHNTFGTLSFC